MPTTLPAKASAVLTLPDLPTRVSPNMEDAKEDIYVV